LVSPVGSVNIFNELQFLNVIAVDLYGLQPLKFPVECSLEQRGGSLLIASSDLGAIAVNI
jgi:hypothetical protein